MDFRCRIGTKRLLAEAATPPLDAPQQIPPRRYATAAATAATAAAASTATAAAAAASAERVVVAVVVVVVVVVAAHQSILLAAATGEAIRKPRVRRVVFPFGRIGHIAAGAAREREIYKRASEPRHGGESYNWVPPEQGTGAG